MLGCFDSCIASVDFVSGRASGETDLRYSFILLAEDVFGCTEPLLKE